MYILYIIIAQEKERYIYIKGALFTAKVLSVMVSRYGKIGTYIRASVCNIIRDV